MDVSLIVLLIIVGLGFYVWSTYNGLVTAKVRVEQSLKDIDVQLKKRYDLLPDLVETAKRATGLDERIFIEVAKVRSEAMKANEAGSTLSQRAQMENQITTMLRDIKVAVEAYPDIKSHGELLDLMNRVTDVEEKIAYSRQFYNSNAGDYNTKIRLFPAVLIAASLGFSGVDYFAAPDTEKEDVKVSF